MAFQLLLQYFCKIRTITHFCNAVSMNSLPTIARTFVTYKRQQNSVFKSAIPFPGKEMLLREMLAGLEKFILL